MSLLYKIILALPSIALAAAIFIISDMPRPPKIDLGLDFGDKVLHFGAYFVFATTLLIALIPLLHKKLAFLFTLFLSAVYGLSDEWHQSFVPGRDSSLMDWAADCMGIIVAAIIFSFLWDRIKKISIVKKLLEKAK